MYSPIQSGPRTALSVDCDSHVPDFSSDLTTLLISHCLLSVVDSCSLKTAILLAFTSFHARVAGSTCRLKSSCFHLGACAQTPFLSASVPSPLCVAETESALPRDMY